MTVVCSMLQCGLDPTVWRELKDGARSGLYSWHPANYTDIWGLTLREELHAKIININLIFPNINIVIAPAGFN